MYLCIQKSDWEGYLSIFSVVLHYQLFIIHYRQASCLASLKCGLVPDICLLYHDSTELKDNAKFLGPIANRTNLRRLNIKVGRIEDVTRDKSGQNFLLNEAVVYLFTYPITRSEYCNTT